MKKYLFFIGTLTDGGAERVVSILSGKMAEQGRKVEILTYYDMPVFYQVHPDIKVICVEKETNTKGKIRNYFWIRRYFKEHANVIVSFLAPFNILALMCNIGTGIPIIVADRNDPCRVPTNPMIRKIRDILYMFADGVVVQTHKNKQYFNRVVQRKSAVIYNPVNLKEYAGIALDTVKSKKIVSVGRLMPQKNQKMLIKAFANIIKKYPEYKLEIYGEKSAYAKELCDLIEDLGIASNVILAGNVADLHDQIKNAELFVLSSNYEGMPNALIEAMCLGLPVVSTMVSGATDLIRQGENGLLVEVGDCQQLETAMLRIIEDREFADNIAHNAVKVNEELDVTQIVYQWLSFVEKYI